MKNKNYHSRNNKKSNIKIVERAKIDIHYTQIHDFSLSGLGTGNFNKKKKWHLAYTLCNPFTCIYWNWGNWTFFWFCWCLHLVQVHLSMIEKNSHSFHGYVIWLPYLKKSSFGGWVSAGHSTNFHVGDNS